MKAALVGCGRSKLAHAAPARRLYTSNLFRLSLAYAEAVASRVFVASALHGLVELDRVIEPYDVDVRGVDRRAWAGRVLHELDVQTGARVAELVLLAGDGYAEPLRREGRRRALFVVEPLRGLELGPRLAWLSTSTSSITNRE